MQLHASGQVWIQAWLKALFWASDGLCAKRIIVMPRCWTSSILWTQRHGNRNAHRSLYFVSPTSPTYTASLASKYESWMEKERDDCKPSIVYPHKSSCEPSWRLKAQQIQKWNQAKWNSKSERPNMNLNDSRRQNFGSFVSGLNDRSECVGARQDPIDRLIQIEQSSCLQNLHAPNGTRCETT